jgi:hypothetical protein
MRIYIHRNNEQLGPFTEAEVKAQLVSGAISPQDHVWWQGQANWIPLGQSPLAAPGVATAVPPVAPASQTANPTVPTLQNERTSGLAMASLIVGIVSILTCGILSIPAVILGHLGLSATKKPDVQGRGLAVAGLVLGYVQLVIVGVVFFFFSASVLALVGLGHAVQKTIDQQNQIFNSLTNNSADQSTSNSGPITNAPEQTTPAPATTNTPDQSTNSALAATNAPDQSTNSPTSSTNSPDSNTHAPATSTNTPDNSTSTNAAPMTQ